jgi:hypothetical protein
VPGPGDAVLAVIRVGVDGRVATVSLGGRRIVWRRRPPGPLIRFPVQKVIGSVAAPTDGCRPGYRPGISTRNLNTFLRTIEGIAVRPSWHELAVCRGLDDLMFPVSTTPKAVAEAAAVCRHCEVFAECQAAAVNETAGIWAAELHTRYPRRLVR